MAFNATRPRRNSFRIQSALPNAPFIGNNPYARIYNTSRFHILPPHVDPTALTPLDEMTPAEYAEFQALINRWATPSQPQYYNNPIIIDLTGDADNDNNE